MTACRLLLVSTLFVGVLLTTAFDLPTAKADHHEKPSANDATDAKALDQVTQDDPNVDEAAEKIKKLLDSDSTDLRWRAARAAARLRLASPEVVEKLQQGVVHGNWLVQLHSIAALARTGDKSDGTIDALTTAALSENDRVAVAAIKALRSLDVDPHKLATTLNKVLDGDHIVATHAVEAVVEAGPKAVPLLKEALKQPNAAFWACVAIADIGPDAAATAPDVAEYLRSNNKAEAAPQALLALAEIGPAAQSTESAVTEAMDRWGDDPSVQLTGMYALGAIDAKNSKARLEAGAKSDDPFIAMVASWALAKTNPGDEALLDMAVQRLVAGLESDNEQMGRAAAHGLASLEMPPGTAAPYLMQAGKDPKARDHIVSALASLGPELVPHASQALENPATRDLAIDVLARLGSEAADATDALAACLQDGDPSACQRVHYLLAQIGPEAATATDELIAQLDSDNPMVRRSAMYALREIGPPAADAKEALLNLIESTDPSTPEGRFDRLAAAWTLARIHPGDVTVVRAVLPVIGDGLDSATELHRTESITAARDLGAKAKSLKERLKKLADSDPAASNRQAAGEVAKSLD